MSLISKNFYLDDIFNDFIASTKVNGMECDIYEKDGDYHIEMDIPGFDKNDINIECKNGYLTITAEKHEEVNEDDKNYIRRERRTGKYERSFYLGEIETDNIEAEFKDGLLKILVPKRDKIDNKKTIQIK